MTSREGNAKNFIYFFTFLRIMWSMMWPALRFFLSHCKHINCECIYNIHIFAFHRMRNKVKSSSFTILRWDFFITKWKSNEFESSLVRSRSGQSLNESFPSFQLNYVRMELLPICACFRFKLYDWGIYFGFFNM